MDSRHKTGYDGGGVGYDGGEASHDGGEGWLHVVAVAVVTDRLVVRGAACRDG
jgi:hypothetical protein